MNNQKINSGNKPSQPNNNSYNYRYGSNTTAVRSNQTNLNYNTSLNSRGLTPDDLEDNNRYQDINNHNKLDTLSNKNFVETYNNKLNYDSKNIKNFNTEYKENDGYRKESGLSKFYMKNEEEIKGHIKNLSSINKEPINNNNLTLQTHVKHTYNQDDIFPLLNNTNEEPNSSYIDQLLNSPIEWKHVNDVVRITIKSLSEMIKIQAASIKDLEKQMAMKASKTELNSGLTIKASHTDVTRRINELEMKIDSKLEKDQFLIEVGQKCNKSDLNELKNELSKHKKDFQEKINSIDSNLTNFNKLSKDKDLSTSVFQQVSELNKALNLKADKKDLIQLIEDINSKPNKEELKDKVNIKDLESIVNEKLGKIKNNIEIPKQFNEQKNTTLQDEFKALKDAFQILNDKNNSNLANFEELKKRLDQKENFLNEIKELFDDKKKLFDEKKKANQLIDEKFSSLEKNFSNMNKDFDKLLSDINKDFNDLYSSIKQQESKNEELNSKSIKYNNRLIELENNIYQLYVPQIKQNRDNTEILVNEFTLFSKQTKDELKLNKDNIDLINYNLSQSNINILTNSDKTDKHEAALKKIQTQISTFDTTYIKLEEFLALKENIQRNLQDQLNQLNLNFENLEKLGFSKLNKTDFEYFLQNDWYNLTQERITISHLEKMYKNIMTDATEKIREYYTPIKEQLFTIQNDTSLNEKVDLKVGVNEFKDLSLQFNNLRESTASMTASIGNLSLNHQNLHAALHKTNEDIRSLCEDINSIVYEIDKKGKEIRLELKEEYSTRLASEIMEINNLFEQKRILINNKADIDDVNKALTSIHDELDTKSVAKEINKKVDQLVLSNECLLNENNILRLVWKGKLRTGHLVPWEAQKINTNTDNFLVDKDRQNVIISSAGVYEIFTCFFTAENSRKPSFQILINNEPLLCSVNYDEYNLFNMKNNFEVSSPLSSNIRIIEYLNLQEKAKISVSISGEAIYGLLSIKKLS